MIVAIVEFKLKKQIFMEARGEDGKLSENENKEVGAGNGGSYHHPGGKSASPPRQSRTVKQQAQNVGAEQQISLSAGVRN
jgi:hypothetical protein